MRRSRGEHRSPANAPPVLVRDFRGADPTQVSASHASLHDGNAALAALLATVRARDRRELLEATMALKVAVMGNLVDDCARASGSTSPLSDLSGYDLYEAALVTPLCPDSPKAAH